jgi:type VI secretion system protein VasD
MSGLGQGGLEPKSNPASAPEWGWFTDSCIWLQMHPHQEEGAGLRLTLKVPTLARCSQSSEAIRPAQRSMNTNTSGKQRVIACGPDERGRLHKLLARGLLRVWVAPVIALAACAEQPPTRPAAEPPAILKSALGYKDKALEYVGIKPPTLPTKPETPDVPDSALPDRRVKLKIFASTSLNVADDGQPLSLVVRVYRLRSMDAFQAAPLATFGDKAKEKELLGDTLVSSREFVLTPGQHYETLDKFSHEAQFIGIVGLFRKPAEGRWRQVFDSRTAEFTGLTLGAHACALSVQVGKPLGTQGQAALAKWSGVSCASPL